MIIKLSPVRSDAALDISKQGDQLSLNGQVLDFGPLPGGATLPVEAFACPWITAPVERVDGSLVLTITLPHGAMAGEQSRYPADIVRPADGRLALPTDYDPKLEGSSPVWPLVPGAIDWSQVVTTEMKAQAAAEQQLAQVIAEAAGRRAVADAAIAPLQDAVDIDDATETEVETLKAWKKYRVALNRVPEQPNYPDAIDWPAPPA